jgi:phenylacetaldehyde dehydrogenase
VRSISSRAPARWPVRRLRIIPIIGAARGNLKKVSLELGGKSPFIILADADIPAAIEGAAANLLWNTGQTCVAGSRLYAHRSVFDAVVSGLTERLRKVTLGHGLDPQADLGPLVSRKQAARVSDYIANGVEAGAELLIGGKRLGPIGTFFEPTLIVKTRSDMALMQEEIFGPVVGCEAFDDLAEVTALANGTIYGLAASVWTSNLSAANRLAEDIRAGTVWVNCHSFFEPTLPVGGFKQSGWGHDSGVLAVEHYLESKTVCMAV